MIVALDADVLIYATKPGHTLGTKVANLFQNSIEDVTEPQSARILIGSALLVPELLIKPTRQGQLTEFRSLSSFLGKIQLHPFDTKLAIKAVHLGSKYGLRTADAAHLATAVDGGADYFLTNNRKDFPKTISETRIIYPTDLPLNLDIATLPSRGVIVTNEIVESS